MRSRSEWGGPPRVEFMARVLIPLLAALALLLWPPDAVPCGGGFGDGLYIDPSQKIVLVHKQGVETYIFSPHFCGTAAQFGLILPVPDTLTESPSLASTDLVAQLEQISEPISQDKTVCREAWDGFADGGAPSSSDGSGVSVVDRGQVGIFDWVLLKADNTAAFTDWLDTNEFPYDPAAATHFDHYVTEGWHFVAFKVTADSEAPPPGSKLCGDLGPLSLSFNSPDPVIPARIAATAVGYWSFGWRVFAITATEQRPSTSITTHLRYSGTLTAAELQANPEVAKLAAAGDRLTKLDLEFYDSISDDIHLEDNPSQKDFRQVIYNYHYVSCDAGVVAHDSGPAPDSGVVTDDSGQPVAPSPDGGSSDNISGGGGCSLPIGTAVPHAPLALLLLVSLLLLLRRR